MTNVECNQIDCLFLKRREGTDYGICQRENVTFKLWIMMDAGRGSRRGQECLHFRARKLTGGDAEQRYKKFKELADRGEGKVQ